MDEVQRYARFGKILDGADCVESTMTVTTLEMTAVTPARGWPIPSV